MGKPIIIISAINLRSGGPLTILQDCLKFLSESNLSKEYRIIALVHKKELAFFQNIEYIEFKDSVGNWVKRIYYEYFKFYRLSIRLNPYLWLSLHDTSPRVKAERQAVYMHNPSIVNKIKWRDFKYDKTYIIFSFLYKYVYRLNIKKNRYCIVQQSWLKDCIANMFSISKNKIIVARPSNRIINNAITKTIDSCKQFFFPSYPRPFKNFETVCEAAKILYQEGIDNIAIKLTIDGTESAYSKTIIEKYKEIPIIHFCGILSHEEMQSAYRETDCLIFPSRLETWGLPISEFIPFNKPIIAADEPYSHETTEGGSCVAFFNTNSPLELSYLIKDSIKGDFSKFSYISPRELEQPFASSYKDLFDLLLCP